VRHDFVFLVYGVPKEFMLHDTDYFFVPASDIFQKELAKLAATYSDIHHWIKRTKGEYLAAAFRNDFPTKEEGMESAYQKLSSIMDGYSLLTEVAPEICPFVQVREGTNHDASWEVFSDRGWARFHSKDGEAEKLWNERTKKLMRRFLVFFDTVSCNAAKPQTDLVSQLALSTKMYRHGCSSDSYGIEFLCKFTALEGLVCGDAKSNKEKLLKKRLSALFRHLTNVEKQIGDLWVMRCEASHQGKAFAAKFAPSISQIEMFTIGVTAFALDHIKQVNKIEDLWKHADTYILPPEAILERPAEIMRCPMTRTVGVTSVKWNNIGPVIDNIFDHGVIIPTA
jgi:hypothetical protein